MKTVSSPLGKVNITSPSSWMKAIAGVVVMFIILGIGFWAYKKLKGMVSGTASGTGLGGIAGADW